MRKKWLSGLLCLILLLELLPNDVLAAERPAESAYWINISANDAKQMFQAVANKTETRRIVFVYYGTDASSQTAATQFAASAANEKFYVYNYYASDGNESLINALTPLFNGMVPQTLPIAVTYNPSAKAYLAKENVATLMAPVGTSEVNGLRDMMQASGIANGGSTPPGSSSGGEDDTPNYNGSSGCSLTSVTKGQWEVLRLVNQHRMGIGVAPLSVFDALQQAANIRAGELINYLSHTRPDGRGYESAFSGIEWSTHAENIASGQTSPADVMNSWLHSPGHKANIERSNKRHIGIGHYYSADDDGYRYHHYWAQNFLAARNCVMYDMKLSRSSIPGGDCKDLEQLLTAADVEVTMQCPVHGKCAMPLIADMCSGYNANAQNDQIITVSYTDPQGVQLTAKLTITTDTMDDVQEITANHVHHWQQPNPTPATCTENAYTTYTCSCGETKTEIGAPATGHHFAIAADSGAYLCSECQTIIPTTLHTVYEELKEQIDPQTSWSLPVSDDGAADASTIENFLNAQIQKTLDGEQDNYRFEIRPLEQLIEAYQYRIAFWQTASAETPMTHTEDTSIIAQADDDSPTFNRSPARSMSKDSHTDAPILVTEILTLNINDLTAVDTAPSLPSSYTINVSCSPINGGNVIGAGRVDANTTVTVSATAASGYRFVRWSENGNTISTASSYTFIATADRTLIAEFVADSYSSDDGAFSDWTDGYDTTYLPIIQQPETGGSVIITPSRPMAGDKVTILPKLDSGHTIEKIVITTQNGKTLTVTKETDGTYTFIQPDSIVKIAISYRSSDPAHQNPNESEWQNPFADVTETMWYYEAIHFVSRHALMNGFEDGSFRPDNALTRAQFAQILYNKEGAPIINAASTFADVTDDQWYATPVAWAATNDLMVGYGKDQFGPNDPITREQMIVILWRYAKQPIVSEVEHLFSDADTITHAAREAMDWAIATGILHGHDDGRLDPQGIVTRAQAAQILRGFIEK